MHGEKKRRDLASQFERIENQIEKRRCKRGLFHKKTIPL